MTEHEKFVLKVTAGPSYDESTHKVVHVNTEQPARFSSETVDASVKARIQDFRGLPSSSPTTSPYFSSPDHTSDRYSIDFRFTPKKHGISGNDLVFGNDFDSPIRDRLPPGFNAAFKFVRWWIDPGLDGDVYADKPYLYGPLLSSVNVLKVGSKRKASGGVTKKGEKAETKKDSFNVAGVGKKNEEKPLEEGAEDEDGWKARGGPTVPADAAGRKKHFLDENRKKEFEFEAGREYHCDFFNPYIDFNEFAVKLPVVTIPILKYWDGQPLRYVLKDRSTATTLLVVVFKLLPMSELNEPLNTTEAAGKEGSTLQREPTAAGRSGGARDDASSAAVGGPSTNVVDDDDDGVD